MPADNAVMPSRWSSLAQTSIQANPTQATWVQLEMKQVSSCSAFGVEEFREAKSALHDHVGFVVVVIGGESFELVVKDLTECDFGVQFSPETLSF